MESNQTDIYLHFPDLLFVRFCEEEYKVNRGVYNTIDRWFYTQGLQNILQRRGIVLDSLQFIKKSQKNEGKIKFGDGRLKEQLSQFWYIYKEV